MKVANALNVPLIEELEPARSFVTYPRLQAHNNPWITSIPAHWRVLRLKHALSRNDGGVWGDEADSGEGTIVLRSTDIKVGGEWNIVDPARRLLTVSEFRSARLRTGDLVVTKSSGSALHLGKTAIVTPDIEALECCYSNFMQRLRVNSAHEPSFVARILNTDIGREQLNFFGSTTTGLANLNGSVIGSIYIPSPPLDEQRAIAGFLDRETAKIDALVAKKQRLIELLQEKRAALISHAVTKGLDPDVPMKESGVEWLGDIPESWDVKKLGNLVHILGGSTPSMNNPAFWNGDVPWVSPKDMKVPVVIDSEDHVTVAAVQQTGLRLLHPPAVLVVVRGMILAHTLPVAMTAVPVTVNQDMKALIPKAGVDAEFLRNSLSGMNKAILSFVEESSHGTKKLETGVLKNLPVAVPSVEQQVSINEHIREQSNRIDSLISKVQEHIERLNEYRSALISAAVTGKIDVRGEVKTS